ncbi:MAG: sugar phosphate isomerase/epimerase, partial [Candidatus Bathyarchaeia archaeon]
MFKNLNIRALGFRLPFQRAVEAAKIGGFQGVDIDIVEMKTTLKSKPIDEVKDFVEENGLKLGGWVLPVNFRRDGETYRRDLEELPDYAEIAEELGCRRVFTWILSFSDELSFDENFGFHVNRLRPVAEIL